MDGKRPAILHLADQQRQEQIGLPTPLSNTSVASSFSGQDSSLYVIRLSTFTQLPISRSSPEGWEALPKGTNCKLLSPWPCFLPSRARRSNPPGYTTRFSFQALFRVPAVMGT